MTHPSIKSIEFTVHTALVQHECEINWPNGEGFTPCSRAYRDLKDQTEDIERQYVDPDTGAFYPDEMNPADYNRYYHLLNEMGNLQLNGHIGKSIRFV